MQSNQRKNADIFLHAMQHVVFEQRIGVEPAQILRIAAPVTNRKPSFCANETANHIIFPPVLRIDIDGKIEFFFSKIANKIHRARFRGIQKIVMMNAIDQRVGLVHFARARKHNKRMNFRVGLRSAKQFDHGRRKQRVPNAGQREDENFLAQCHYASVVCAGFAGERPRITRTISAPTASTSVIIVTILPSANALDS